MPAKHCKKLMFVLLENLPFFYLEIIGIEVSLNVSDRTEAAQYNITLC